MRERPLEINKMIEEFLMAPAMAQAR
jgi:hypothetical protein